MALAKAGADSATKGGIAAEVAALVAAEGLTEMAALKRVAKERGLGKSEAYREFQRNRISGSRRGAGR
jgi:16S rRNA (cytidine1402-2'-O)-methyltransferase